MKVDEGSEQLNMICCFDTQEHYETLVQEDGGRCGASHRENSEGTKL